MTGLTIEKLKAARKSLENPPVTSVQVDGKEFRFQYFLTQSTIDLGLSCGAIIEVDNHYEYVGDVGVPSGVVYVVSNKMVTKNG